MGLFGDIVMGLGGGKKSKESSVSNSTSHSESESQSRGYSGNYYKDYIQDEYNPQINRGNQAGHLIAGLLGMPGGDTSSASDAFDGYKRRAGYDFALGQGVNALDGSQAARGMLTSGSTLKGLEKYRQGLSSQYMSQFLDNLLKQQTGGIQAGSIISDAGKYSEQSAASKSVSDASSQSRSKGSSMQHGGLLDVLKTIGGMAAMGAPTPTLGG